MRNEVMNRHRPPSVMVEVRDAAGTWIPVGEAWGIAGAGRIEAGLRAKDPQIRVRVVTKATGHILWDSGVPDVEN